jgi:predicted acylesterase/phospholipase RssA
MTISLAFNGAFFAWPYQAGVAAYVQERGLLDANSRVYGTSSGAVVAVMLACGVDIARVGMPAGLAANERAKAGKRTPFFNPAPVIPTYFEIFGPTLPADAHERATGRLYVSATKLPRFEKTILSRYPSNSALLDALAASIAIPGVTVRFAYKTEHHGYCLDGGPEVPDDDRPGVQTIRVGVGPRIPMMKVDHITPSTPIGVRHRLLVAPEAERREIFELGYADARRYWA